VAPEIRKGPAANSLECVADIKSAVVKQITVSTLEIMRNYYAEIVQGKKEVERIAFTSKDLKYPYVCRPQPQLASHKMRSAGAELQQRRWLLTGWPTLRRLTYLGMRFVR
jgi:hypothetical protein